MRESVLFLILFVIVNKVTAPAPYHLPKINLPYPKPSTPPAPKISKWSEYTSKNSAAKPMKDNAYLASLVKKPPKDIQKIKTETNIAEENKPKLEKEECLNSTEVLFAEELVKPLNELAGNETKEKEIPTEVKKVEDPKLKLNATEPRKGVKLHELFKQLNTKPKVNNTENQNKTFEIPPLMIPIFRPNPNVARSQIAKENLDFISTTPNSVAPIKDIPAPVEKVEKLIIPIEVKPNLNSNPNAIPFNIPCHKASDVLDEVPVKLEVLRTSQVFDEVPAKLEVLRTSQAKSDLIPKAVTPVLQEPNQVEKPEKLEIDESVAIIFKPKNISLLNVYGDLLKKITLTVLVPYHISKLGT